MSSTASQSLLQEVRARGFVRSDELDRLLEPASTSKRFESIARSLLTALRRVGLRLVDSDDSESKREEVSDFSFLLRSESKDSPLAVYIREVLKIPRMEKDDEVRLGKRLEFVRRRFFQALLQGGVKPKLAREILDYSRLRPLLEQDTTQDPLLNQLPSGPAFEVIRQACFEYQTVREEYVRRNLHVVIGAAAAYRTYGVPLLDLIQEGNAGLIRAVEKFDWRKNVRFRTYATFWIRQAVERAIAANKGIVRVPNYLQQKMRRLRREGAIPRKNEEKSLTEISKAFELPTRVVSRLLETERSTRSLDVAVGDDGDDPLSSLLPADEPIRDVMPWEAPVLKGRIHDALRLLNDHERTILEYRYGIGRAEPMTLEEVGRLMKVSRERVRQLQVRAIRKLQAPAVMARLAGFV